MHVVKPRAILRMLSVVCLCHHVTGVSAEAPFVHPDGEEEYFGSAENVLFWEPEQQVAGYRNSDKIFPTRTIQAGDSVYSLPYELIDLDDVEINSNDASMSVGQYFTQQSIAGLLVIKNGKVLYERYGLGNTEDSRWISYSVAKSVVAMLIGAAIQDGYIASVDEKVTQYLPRLKGSSYDQSTIANLLQMASGVQWNEDYTDPKSDVNSASWETIKLYEYLRNKPRSAEPGVVFNYNTAETNLAGTLLRSAVGNNLSTYLSEKIWKPFGMESDASWNLTEPGGGEFGGCCINATLRDYGRIGLFALANGRLADGTEVLPPRWMQESTAPSEGSEGYGYFWWLFGKGEYAAIGIFGQTIYINHNNGLVIAIHSARPLADDDTDWAWDQAFFEAIANATTD